MAFLGSNIIKNKREESRALPSVEDYEQAKLNKRTRNDVVALFYDDATKKIAFVCFTMFDKDSISYYLDSSDGKAISYRPEKQKYWYLQSESDNNLLLFRQGTSKEKPFEDIDPINDFNAFLMLVNAANPD